MSKSFDFASDLNHAVYDWWVSAHDGETLPRGVDYVALARSLASCILLDVERDPDDFRYRFVGTRVDEFMFQPMTGKRMSELPAQKPPSTIWSIMCRVRDDKTPRSGEVPYVGPKKEFVRMEDIIVPLSSDGESVTSLLIGVDYFRDEGAD